MKDMSRPGRALCFPFLLLAFLAFPVLDLAGQEGQDVGALIADLADLGPKGVEAVKKLKALDPAPVAALKEAAADEDPARRLRARAILRFHETVGDSGELHFLLTVAAWDLPKDGAAVLAAEKAAARAVLNQEKDIIPVLLSTYPQNDYRRYSVARDILKERGAPIIPLVVPLLKHPDFVARLRAVHLLALISGEEAMKALSQGSLDTNAQVRARVLDAWITAKGPWAEKAGAFAKDPDASIRAKAVRGLGGESPVTAKGLWDESFMVRRAAAETLAAGKGPGEAALLAAAKKETSSPGRFEALRGLGLYLKADSSPRAVEVLSGLLNHDDWAVRAAAAQALGLGGKTELLPAHRLHETHPFARYRLAEALGEALSAVPPDPGRFRDKPSIPPVPAGAGAIAWLRGDFAALDDALLALRMTRKDLQFDRNLTMDPYRIPVVQKTLNEPLAIAGVTREASVAIRSAMAQDPTALVGFVAARIGHQPKEGKTGYQGLAVALKKLAEAELPKGLLEPLRRFLSADRWPLALEAAFAGLKPEDRRKILTHKAELAFDPELLPVWDKVDTTSLATAASLFHAACGKLAADLQAVRTEKTGLLWSTPTPFGPVLIHGSGRDRHETPAFLLIDLGGDDFYAGPAAAAALGDETKNAAAVVIDVSGDDIYRTTEAVSQGAGILGLGALCDLTGNDIYRAVANAQGCGCFGAGILVDWAGDDRYEADLVSQGAGSFGYGVLADLTGHDVYYARAYSQGFGFVQGAGVLADAEGNDLYYVDGKYLQYETLPHRKLSMGQGVGYGMRPMASGGVGILWEGGGDDVYRGNAFAQGTSYWFSLGILVDEEGFDNYSAKIYSQASGIHMGVGVLCDLKGNDNYLSWGLSQSGSHDLGVSYFLDSAGDDIYTCHDASIGGAINHAVAIFVDRSGRDAYFHKNKMAVGAADTNRRKDHDSIGIFLDLGGAEDTYSSQKGGNGAFWVEGNFGIGIDR